MAEPYYGLIPLCVPAYKRWAVEIDYVEKLSPAEAAWLDRFTREFHEGAVKKDDDEALHASDALRRDCYRRNNAQNRDLYGRTAARGLLHFEDFGVTAGNPEGDWADDLDGNLIFCLPLYLLALCLLQVYVRR